MTDLKIRPFAVVALLLASSLPTVAQEKPLTLQEAVSTALASNDPYLLEPAERAEARAQNAIADSQLPDPKVRLAFANWPTNSFSYSQEAMTQMQVGLSQAFPRGDSRRLMREQQQVKADAYRHQQALHQLEIIRDTQKSWLDLYYLAAARQRVEASRQAISELVSVTQSSFATGKNKSQDIFRAEMELALLDDRLIELQQKFDAAQARLARRIGSHMQILPLGQPAMKHPDELDLLRDSLQHHPRVKMRRSNLKAAEKGVSLAGEQYKPGWAVSVGYGARGADRADFATVGVTFDVPLFTKNRQDKRVSAAKKSRQAEQLSLDAVLLDMERQLRSVHAVWHRSAQRIKLYKDVVRSRAKETSVASLSSYQSGVTDFPELVRSRLAELDIELKLLELEKERHKAQADLLFLQGGDDA